MAGVWTGTCRCLDESEISQITESPESMMQTSAGRVCGESKQDVYVA